ncbi:hypothetical protein KAR91_69875 [Candidatus Pacearchaeota archaeon]|nr:hypothetical protein [Candidatus Pacearchaeota archaeon]
MECKWEHIEGPNRRLTLEVHLSFYGEHNLKSDYGSDMGDEMIPHVKKSMIESCIEAMQAQLDQAKEDEGI